MKNYAVVLAGGKGTRMNSSVPKQYLNLNGFPVLYYSLMIFEKSEIIDEIILVISPDDEEYVKKSILFPYGLKKIASIAYGGAQRYDSVHNALKKINEDGWVFIHDGARPCINTELIRSLYKDALQYGNAVCAVKAKDTIKVADENGYAINTPDRNCLYQIQTPQVFNSASIKKCYELMEKDNHKEMITDDAMVMERYGHEKVKLSSGLYSNIKITTSEDMTIASAFLSMENTVS